MSFFWPSCLLLKYKKVEVFCNLGFFFYIIALELAFFCALYLYFWLFSFHLSLLPVLPAVYICSKLVFDHGKCQLVFVVHPPWCFMRKRQKKKKKRFWSAAKVMKHVIITSVHNSSWSPAVTLKYRHPPGHVTVWGHFQTDPDAIFILFFSYYSKQFFLQRVEQ